MYDTLYNKKVVYNFKERKKTGRVDLIDKVFGGIAFVIMLAGIIVSSVFYVKDNSHVAGEEALKYVSIQYSQNSLYNYSNYENQSFKYHFTCGSKRSNLENIVLEYEITYKSEVVCTGTYNIDTLSFRDTIGCDVYVDLTLFLTQKGYDVNAPVGSQEYVRMIMFMNQNYFMNSKITITNISADSRKAKEL